LDLARRAILNAVVEKRILDFSDVCHILTEPAGAFVTLIKTADSAVALAKWSPPIPGGNNRTRRINAALHDPDFRRRRRWTLKVLKLKFPCFRSAPIAAGCDSLGTSRSADREWQNQGLLLPQVATRAPMVLAAVSRRDLRKAGLRATLGVNLLLAFLRSQPKFSPTPAFA